MSNGGPFCVLPSSSATTSATSAPMASANASAGNRSLPRCNRDKGGSTKLSSVTAASATTATTSSATGNRVSQHGKSSSSSSSANPLFKTELCKSFRDKGTCPYGNRCQFAHGESELRTRNRHPRYKTVVCRTFSRTGRCPYGERCRFIHRQTGDADDSSSEGGASAESGDPGPPPARARPLANELPDGQSGLERTLLRRAPERLSSASSASPAPGGSMARRQTNGRACPASSSTTGRGCVSHQASQRQPPATAQTHTCGDAVLQQLAPALHPRAASVVGSVPFGTSLPAAAAPRVPAPACIQQPRRLRSQHVPTDEDGPVLPLQSASQRTATPLGPPLQGATAPSHSRQHSNGARNGSNALVLNQHQQADTSLLRSGHRHMLDDSNVVPAGLIGAPLVPREAPSSSLIASDATLRPEDDETAVVHSMLRAVIIEDDYYVPAAASCV
mmetsp:Transcript_18440/g.47490  ORF Transcript_18440/g.47490 Transcript_18440/m.47490 type:complete len:447 (-) Transcript_18440:91-1431(-)|eukprot:CAMPEP_0119416490 /NCGR_PEP_ID=MMETSP1335-20130426/13096_1 /TAXON_ID=259385 /ORGANISM="Chrysoculter rhomboideus, Strain RCC1486" /LENGTH=446 /DNA_ID=CAMNT_0007441617 /DNA_START=115 /DNA_END=1455 /DNA_ORIENTATION=-